MTPALTPAAHNHEAIQRTARTADLRAALDDLRQDWPALLLPPSSTGRATGKPGSRLPIDDQRLHLAEHVPPILAAWRAMTIDQRGLRPQRLATDVPTMATWLDAHAPWLAAHELADQATAELTQAARQVHAVVHPSGVRIIDVCPCPRPQCPGRVAAVLDPAKTETHATCDVDPAHTWAEHQWADLHALTTDAASRLPDAMTAPALAAWMSTHYRATVDGATIRTWARRHRDFPRPHHRTGLWPRLPVALWFLDHRSATHRGA